jgi:threonine aldolase
MVGGSMRQAGTVAAAGLIALDRAEAQIREDHANARLLADGLRRLPGIAVDRAEVQTNIFFIRLTFDALTPQQFAARLKEGGILVSAPRSGTIMRLVTHCGVTREDIATVLRAVEEVLHEGGATRPEAELAATGPY